MAKTETVRVEGVSRTWLPPLDGGTLLMAVLIGFMGFYVLYPLILILINSFNTATIAEPPVYGLKAWQEAFNEPGIWRSLWNSVKIGIALQVIAFILPTLLNSAFGCRFFSLTWRPPSAGCCCSIQVRA
jgi:ABC-type spermidine/putrescine transport system permease subunit II